MYNSPITELIGDMHTEMIKEHDNQIMFRVKQTIGYNIDKDELIKALNYDRQQYEKGYEDGLNADKWIPVKTTLPKEDGEYLTLTEENDVYLSWWDGKSFSCQDRIHHCEGEVIAWQEKPKKPRLFKLPEPFKD